MAAQMVAIWNETVANTPLRQARTPRDPAFIARLAQTIRASEFTEDLGAWRKFCAFASQDPHCRGERNSADYVNWTADLAHVIQPHVRKRLLDARNEQRKQAAEQKRHEADGPRSESMRLSGISDLVNEFGRGPPS